MRMGFRMPRDDAGPKLELFVLAGADFYCGSDCNAKTNAKTYVVDCHA